jgi:chromosome segregation ATPase
MTHYAESLVDEIDACLKKLFKEIEYWESMCDQAREERDEARRELRELEEKLEFAENELEELKSGGTTP